MDRQIQQTAVENYIHGSYSEKVAGGFVVAADGGGVEL